LFEIITWNQLTIHDKQIFILNSGGFYDHLIQHIQLMKQEGFLYEDAIKRIIIINEPGELITHSI
jgi:predicted Rossmann-fold nucleotide-binding protein